MNDWLTCADIINRGGIAVIPTDTLYGIVAKATNHEAVQRLYSIKKRLLSKPFIILISDTDQLKRFNVPVSLLAKTSAYWPGPYSLILPFNNTEYNYLANGKNTLAFRLPNKPELINLINKTGPIVAPSANPRGLPPAKNIAEAKKYFGDLVDIYVDGGEIKNGQPSKLLDIVSGQKLR
ncbi:threonylcarbamoyl-AMP synthase [Candidatus Saccharibacteria bacterium]|jgi:L-threonylcarbamoyladenylate synthase|nr:threonylcarbamoyl-AMP synthase [Candidatus Saccharibacteria bacterium]HPW47797.1 L-threonylcarbamoyladenylate synthase [Candidatus Saccharibacteria bacterium]